MDGKAEVKRGEKERKGRGGRIGKVKTAEEGRVRR